MEICITGEQLRKALKQIEQAEQQGFMHCLSIFAITQAGRYVSDCLAEHEGLILRAHPTDGEKDWGRIANQFLGDYRYIDGRLVDLSIERDDLSPGRWAADRGYFEYYYPDKDWDEFVRLGEICSQLSDSYLTYQDHPGEPTEYGEYCEDPEAYVAKVKTRLSELPPDPGRNHAG